MGMSGDYTMIGRVTAVLLCSACLFATWTPARAALWLGLPPSETKCVSEEIHDGVVVVADYSIIHEDDARTTSTITAKVTSPEGTILHHRENATTGTFGFTTSEPGNYLACFWQDGAQKVAGISVSINWKTGIAAKDWESVAKRENIEGVELELRKLEEAVEVIHEDLLYLRTREASMRDVSEKTNTRVALFGIMSIGVCILGAVLQLWYLEGFFHRKKLI